MRKAVLLTAASIILAATVSASAKSTVLKQCVANFSKCVDRAISNNPYDKDKYFAAEQLCHTALMDCEGRTKIEREFLPPVTTSRRRDPIGVPPAGLLETTPGFSPQGPAGMGTPSGGGRGSVSGPK
jgi:hypothetical protein